MIKNEKEVLDYLAKEGALVLPIGGRRTKYYKVGDTVIKIVIQNVSGSTSAKLPFFVHQLFERHPNVKTFIIIVAEEELKADFCKAIEYANNTINCIQLGNVPFNCRILQEYTELKLILNERSV